MRRPPCKFKVKRLKGGGFPPIVRAALDFAPIARWARIGVRTFVRPDAFGDLQRDADRSPNQRHTGDARWLCDAAEVADGMRRSSPF